MKDEYICELCGNPTSRKIIRIIEGVEMIVCDRCKEYGEPPPPPRRSRRTVHDPYFAGPGGNITVKRRSGVRRSPVRFVPPSGRSAVGSHARSPSAVGSDYGVDIDRLELVDNYREILRKERMRRGMTQAEFARSVNISETTYKHIEAGRLDMTISDALKFEKKYNIRLVRPVDRDTEDEGPTDVSAYIKKSDGYTLGDVFFMRKRKRF